MKRLAWLAPVLFLTGAHAEIVDPPRRILRVEDAATATTHCGQNLGAWPERWSTDGSTLGQCGGWSPSDDADLKHWYRGDAFLTDVDGIHTATDKAGSDDITQATGAKKPDEIANELNGHTVARHDGTDDVLVGALGASLAQPTTLFLVGKVRAVSASDQVFFDGDDATNRQAIYNRTTGSKLSCFAGTILNGPAEDTNWHYYVVVFDGASTKFRVDGTEFTGDAGTNAIDGFTVGANNAEGSHLDGDWADLGLYSKAADADLISNLETYMKDRYGLSLLFWFPLARRRRWRMAA